MLQVHFTYIGQPMIGEWNHRVHIVNWEYHHRNQVDAYLVSLVVSAIGAGIKPLGTPYCENQQSE